MTTCQTLFKHQKSADSTIAILKRMNVFKAYMKIQNILEGMCLD